SEELGLDRKNAKKLLNDERHVEANDHEPEAPFAEPLRKHAAAHFRKPILQATEHCEDDCAYRHEMKMRHKEIAVLSLPVERHAGMTDSGDARDKELDETGES